MAAIPIQAFLENSTSPSFQDCLPIMVNACTGKMGKSFIEAATAAGLYVVPVSLSSEAKSGQTYQICGKEFLVQGPSNRESFLAFVLDKYPNLIVVDFTVPTAVNGNAELYCKVGVPFVMGTNGGDRNLLYKTVTDSNVYALIAPQLGKQVVAFHGAMEIAADYFPAAFWGYSLEVLESHQASKADSSGTVEDVTFCFNRLGASLDMDQILHIRDPKQQRELVGIPEEYLSGHSCHIYLMTSPDETSIYSEGAVDAVNFLAKKIETKDSKRIYTMFDVVLESCNKQSA